MLAATSAAPCPDGCPIGDVWLCPCLWCTADAQPTGMPPDASVPQVPPPCLLDPQASVAELQWQSYQQANEAFADAVMALQLSDSDYVWVQDYHLMLLPKMLRERAPSMSIGWFLHTPFSTSEMYRTLPHREEILRGVLGADLVGFHIYDYARHFHVSCSRVLGTGGTEGITEGNGAFRPSPPRPRPIVHAFSHYHPPIALFSVPLSPSLVDSPIALFSVPTLPLPSSRCLSPNARHCHPPVATLPVPHPSLPLSRLQPPERVG